MVYNPNLTFQSKQLENKYSNPDISDNDQDDVDDDEARAKRMFPTREAAKMFVERYEKRAHVVLRVKNSGGERRGHLHYECKQGKRRKSQGLESFLDTRSGKEMKRRRKSEKKDCPFYLKFNTRVSGKTMLTQVNLEHNH